MRLTMAVELDEELGALLRCAGVAQQPEEEGARRTSLEPTLGLMLDLLLLTHTACGLPVRKISSQVNSRVFRPRSVVTLMSPVKWLEQNVNLKGQHRIDELTKFMASCLESLVMKSPDHPSPLWYSYWWCTSVCSSVIVISIHQIHRKFLHESQNDFLSTFVLLPPPNQFSPSLFMLPSLSSPSAVLPPPPSTVLPPQLSLAAVWGDGCGFCRDVSITCTSLLLHMHKALQKPIASCWASLSRT